MGFSIAMLNPQGEVSGTILAANHNFFRGDLPKTNRPGF